VVLRLAGEFDAEGKLRFLKEAVAIVADGNNPDANALARVEQLEILRRIHELERVRPLLHDDGVREDKDLLLDLRGDGFVSPNARSLA
jgi:hypothetical protein